jgi:hypothetical protein
MTPTFGGNDVPIYDTAKLHQPQPGFSLVIRTYDNINISININSNFDLKRR